MWKYYATPEGASENCHMEKFHLILTQGSILKVLYFLKVIIYTIKI